VHVREIDQTCEQCLEDSACVALCVYIYTDALTTSFQFFEMSGGLEHRPYCVQTCRGNTVQRNAYAVPMPFVKRIRTTIE
jgi:hypothetical protein